MAINDLMSRAFDEMVSQKLGNLLNPDRFKDEEARMGLLGLEDLYRQLQQPVEAPQDQPEPQGRDGLIGRLIDAGEKMHTDVPQSENQGLIAPTVLTDAAKNQTTGVPISIPNRYVGDDSAPSLFNRTLQQFGRPGQGLARALNPITSKIGNIAGDWSQMLEKRARAGGLSALAPEYSASMQNVMDREQKERELNMRFGPEGSATLSQRRLHSTFEGGNGNQMIAMQDPNAPEGFRIHDSGIPWNPSLDIQRQPDGTFVAFDRNNPQKPPRILWKPTEAEAAHARAVDQAARMESATTKARLQAVAKFEYPATHLALEQGFDEIGMYMNDLQETISLAIDTNPGGWQAILTKGWPASDQRRLNNRITSLKANLTFENLVALKKSGVGLGAVSDAELKLLADRVAVLDIAAEPIDTVRDLRRIYSQYNMMQANFHDLAVVAAEQAGVEPTPLEDFGSGSPDAGDVPQSFILTTDSASQWKGKAFNIPFVINDTRLNKQNREALIKTYLQDLTPEQLKAIEVRD